MGAPRFLVVEDNRAEAAALARRIARAGLGEAVVAHDWAHAEALLGARTPYAAFLFDIVLPDGSGLDALAFARAHGYPFTPASIISGALDHDAINRATCLGARIFAKPVSFEGAIAPLLRDAVDLPARVKVLVKTWRDSDGLSEAEADVLERLAAGQDVEMIAKARGCSVLTVRKHVANLLRRTGDDSREHALLRLLLEALRM